MLDKVATVSRKLKHQRFVCIPENRCLKFFVFFSFSPTQTEAKTTSFKNEYYTAGFDTDRAPFFRISEPTIVAYEIY